MKNRQEHWRDRLGTPRSFVLYRTPDLWRYAVHFSGGIVDGYLVQPCADSEIREAQTAALAKAEELAGQPLKIAWEPSDKPDRWTGTVTTGPSEPTSDSAAG
ncbi:hypothetical protein [Streptomyces sp. NPDC003863]